jgi:hypothetical protein
MPAFAPIQILAAIPLAAIGVGFIYLVFSAAREKPPSRFSKGSRSSTERQSTSKPSPHDQSSSSVAAYDHAFGSLCIKGVLDESDWVSLDALAAELDLGAVERSAIEAKHRKPMIAKHVGNIIASGDFDPQTAHSLAVWTQAMRGTADDIEAGELEELEHLARAWSLGHDALPLIEVPIALQRGELCHAESVVLWQELRSRSMLAGSYGPVARIPLAAGLSFRLAAYKHTRLERSALETIDHGPLYITNKRVIFNGAKKNTSIRLNAIINVTPHENGIVIDKSSGRSPHLELFGGDPLLISVILRRVISEANA